MIVTVFLVGLQKNVFFIKKPNLVGVIGFWVFWGLNLRFVKIPNFMGSGISMGFQLLE